MLRKFWDVFFKGDFAKYGKQVFRDYYAEVESLVPPERLLKYEVKQGWEPLCNFLDVPVPKNKSFPRTNDTDGFVDRCKTRNRAQMCNVAFRALVMAGSITAVVATTAVTLHRFKIRLPLLF